MRFLYVVLLIKLWNVKINVSCTTYVRQPQIYILYSPGLLPIEGHKYESVDGHEGGDHDYVLHNPEQKNTIDTNPGQDWPDPDQIFKKKPDPHPGPTGYDSRPDRLKGLSRYILLVPVTPGCITYYIKWVTTFWTDGTCIHLCLLYCIVFIEVGHRVWEDQYVGSIYAYLNWSCHFGGH